MHPFTSTPRSSFESNSPSEVGCFPYQEAGLDLADPRTRTQFRKKWNDAIGKEAARNPICLEHRAEDGVDKLGNPVYRIVSMVEPAADVTEADDAKSEGKKDQAASSSSRAVEKSRNKRSLEAGEDGDDNADDTKQAKRQQIKDLDMEDIDEDLASLAWLELPGGAAAAVTLDTNAASSSDGSCDDSSGGAHGMHPMAADEDECLPRFALPSIPFGMDGRGNEVYRGGLSKGCGQLALPGGDNSGGGDRSSFTTSPSVALPAAPPVVPPATPTPCSPSTVPTAPTALSAPTAPDASPASNEDDYLAHMTARLSLTRVAIAAVVSVAVVSVAAAFLRRRSL